jgi:signal transduction histidine kinase/CheY-like chemotaxis protein
MSERASDAIPRRARSFRKHLVLLLLAAVLPLIVFAGVLTSLFWQQQRDAFEMRYLERVRAMALALDREQDGHIRVLQTLAHSTLLAQGDLSAFYEQAKAVKAEQPGWATVILADLHAAQLLNLRQPFGTVLQKTAFGEEGVARVAATGRPLITPLITGNVAGNQVTNIGVPVRRNGVVTHVLIAGIDPPAWLEFLRRYPVAADATMTLLDQNGIVIARTLNHERWIGKQPAPSLYENSRALPEAAYTSVGLEGQSFYSAFSRSGRSGWTIATGVPAATVEAALRRSTLAMFGGALFCLGLAAGLAYLFGRRIAQSIAALAGSAAQLGSARQLSSPPNAATANNIAEINTLGRVLNESAARLHSEHLERERAQQALRQSEQRFRALTAASSDVLYRMSPNWTEMRQLDSEGFIEETEAPTGEWIQKYIPVDEQPRVMEVMNEAIRTKSTFELEHRVLRVDGSPGWTFSRAVPILNANCEITEWFGAASDVTERKHAEKALRTARMSAERAKADAERANHAKDQFLAVLSHELRTPLTPVLAAAELLQRRQDLSPDARAPLEIIRRNVQLQARLIDDLLDLTRIAHGKIELKRKPINICSVIERAVEIAKPDIEARRLHFEVSFQDVPHWVDADASRLQQVVWNLLSNAIKFTPEGGCVGLRCEVLDGHVVIEVADSGIGIEPEASARIFGAFEQGERSITRQFGGLGLGLSIAKRLVEMHDGTISVHSEGRNKGATFRVQLPMSTEPLEASAHKGVPAFDGRARRILLVEDSGDTALMMKMLLEAFGYEVETAGDVSQALQAIDSTTFDLLISDLGLPDRSGIDLMQELRRRRHPLKGIALSGYGQEEDMRRSKDAGFAVHLVKPVDADLLMETIEGIE